jgi:hypothetical protein
MVDTPQPPQPAPPPPKPPADESGWATKYASQVQVPPNPGAPVKPADAKPADAKPAEAKTPEGKQLVGVDNVGQHGTPGQPGFRSDSVATWQKSDGSRVQTNGSWGTNADGVTFVIVSKGETPAGKPEKSDAPTPAAKPEPKAAPADNTATQKPDAPKTDAPKDPAAPPKAEEGVGSFLEGLVLGDFAGNDSWSAIAGQSIGGFIPVVGQIADARDIAHAVGDVVDGKVGAWTELAINVAGVVPGLDVLKGPGKVGKEFLSHADDVGKVVKHADDAAKAGKNIESAAAKTADKELAGFQKMVKDETGAKAVAGEPLQLHPYSAGTDVRKTLQPPVPTESAHGVPRSVGRGVEGYDPRAALTTLEDKATHHGLDQGWKTDFQDMRRAGRTEATGQEIYDTLAKSIDQSTLTDGAKDAMKQRLQSEMFSDLGMSQSAKYPLPYPNIPPR